MTLQRTGDGGRRGRDRDLASRRPDPCIQEPPMSNPKPWLASLMRWLGSALLALVAACGGGGDATDPAPPQSAPSDAAAVAAEAPVAAQADTAPPVAGTRATCNLAEFESETMALLNAHRAAGAQCGDRGAFDAAAPLFWNAPLTAASLVHSDDMAANNFFDHAGSDGSSAGQRASAAGYVWSAWGENIAAGQSSVRTVIAAWMASPGHCANIMNANFRDVGLACVSGGAGSDYRSYWTMTLGRSR
jgi:uncharacterized protein YkwD